LEDQDESQESTSAHDVTFRPADCAREACHMMS
jgi:hypothetical protein